MKIEGNEMRYSKSYHSTVNTTPAAMVRINRIRDSLRLINAGVRLAGGDTTYRLFVRPRLGKNNPARALYARGGALHRETSQDIKREHGVRFDLYVYKRCNR
jgi:hypothetical protein